MRKRRLIPWQLPALVVASLGAIGTGVVVTAKYITLPDRVEAEEKKNIQQDKQLDRLIALQEYYQQKEVTRAPRPDPSRVPEPIREVDEDGQAWCCATDSQTCWHDKTWKHCE